MRTQISRRIKQLGYSTLVVMLIGVYPMPVRAAATTPVAPVNNSQPTTPASGPMAPNGAEASSFTLNKTTGLWENDHYIWDPVTRKTTPKTPQNYSYNPATGMWDTKEWRYDAPSSTYVPNTVSVPTNPNPSVPSGSSASTAPSQPKTAGSSTTPAGNGGATIVDSSKGSGAYSNYYDATISNKVKSNAVTGNVSALKNTSVGNATSGDASAMATILNLLQSDSVYGKGGFATFNADIRDNRRGDLHVDPNILSLLQPSANGSIQVDRAADVKINQQANGTINNQVKLGAESGAVTASKNSSAGNVTSGDANTVANVVDLIRTSASVGKSFLGSINIHGNLDGDILFPAGFIDSIIAANGPNSTRKVNQTTSVNSGVKTAAKQASNTVVKTNASTGKVSAIGNTSVGDAVSGDARTNVTMLNLTNRDVVADDALLVFVNVLGNWVGMFMDAPRGTTAAALGGGLQKNTLKTVNASANTTDNHTINNDIDLTSASGDVAASQNTSVGNVKSGNATASANLTTISDSSLSFKDWFGILFINVFGSWNGSFGKNTSAGDDPATKASKAVGNTVASSHKPVQAVAAATSGVYGSVTKAKPAVAEVAAASSVPVTGMLSTSVDNSRLDTAVEPVNATTTDQSTTDSSQLTASGIDTRYFAPVGVIIGLYLLIEYRKELRRLIKRSNPTNISGK